MRKRLACIASGLLLLTATASAAETQAAPPDFSYLNIRVGDTVMLLDLGTGAHIGGRVSQVTPAEIWVNGHPVKWHNRLNIDRVEDDPIWQGAAIGFAIGSVALFPVFPETVVPRGGRFRINNGLIWGAVGALIDHVHRRRTTIYRGS